MSTISKKHNLSLYIGISPIGTLTQTAKELEKAFSGIEFYEDDSGRYEEFPAFCAKALDYDLVLLGMPDEDAYLGDDPIDYFELHIKFRTATREDIYNHFLNLIQEYTNLNCWLLE